LLDGGIKRRKVGEVADLRRQVQVVYDLVDDSLQSVCHSLQVDEAHLPATEGEVLDEAVPADPLWIAARKRNSVGMANFAISFTDETAMGMIYKAISTEWPTSKTSIVVALLLRRFKPEDTMTRVELH
jgi:hypothetical protein